MKTIPLTQGKVAIVDDDDYEKLSKDKWCLSGSKKYACKRDKITKSVIYMHVVIMETPKGRHTDHINGNTLDNRKENLRICTCSENLMNMSKRKDNSSGFKGVYFDKKNDNWVAEIKKMNKKIWLGRYSTKILAAKAYDIAAIKYHGEFAKLNFN